MRSRLVVIGCGFVALVLLVLYVLGTGALVSGPIAGSPEASAVSAAVIAERASNLRKAAVDIGVAKPKQILVWLILLRDRHWLPILNCLTCFI